MSAYVPSSGHCFKIERLCDIHYCCFDAEVYENISFIPLVMSCCFDAEVYENISFIPLVMSYHT